MSQARLSIGKYIYIHHGHKGTQHAINVHDVFIMKNRVRVFLSYLGILLFLAKIYYLILTEEKIASSSNLSIIFWVFYAKVLQYKPVKKESVVIMPAFGLQLETHFWSGRVIRRFVPMGKILRPVLNECVTPVTCYWSLALILHGEEKLMLVFQELQPPLKMLIPVWKALCAATNCKEKLSSS